MAQEDARESTDSEQRRFHDDYRTAEAVKDNHQSNLSSDTGTRIRAEAREPGLPTRPGERDEFMELRDRFEVK